MMTSALESAIHAVRPEQLERTILELALQRTGSENGSVFVWDNDHQALRLDFHTVRNIDIDLAGRMLYRRKDGRRNGIAWYVFTSEEPYLCNDTRSDPYYAPYFLDLGSLIGVPILYQHRAIGVICVGAFARNAYTELHMAELEALAGSCAKFLRRAQLYRSGATHGRRPMYIKGLSQEWRAVEDLIERVSPTNAPVLVRGESGTGKELVANSIHFNSARADRPFVAVNCAAISEQLLESTLFGHVRGAFTGASFAKVGEFQKADGGTLFLDELGELTPILQAKVLRAIEVGEVQPLGSNDPPKRVDVRLLAATNRPIEEMCARGLFREDLYFRIAVITIRVPPLRTYLNNLDVLCQEFVTQANEQYDRQVHSISPAAMALLRSHQFPGNVRELRNILDHAVIVCRGDTLQPEDLPLLAPRGHPLQREGLIEALPARRQSLATLRKQWVAERERPYIAQVLDECNGRIPAAAKALGIDRTSLYRLLKKYDIRLDRRVAR